MEKSLRLSLLLLLPLLLLVWVASCSARFPCGVCVCSADGSVMWCPDRRLREVPAFSPDITSKVRVLALQRNLLRRLDGRALASAFPMLTTLDISSQLLPGIRCVSLDTPLPSSVDVRGELCDAALGGGPFRPPPFFAPNAGGEEAEPEADEDELEPAPPPPYNPDFGSSSSTEAADSTSAASDEATTAVGGSTASPPMLAHPAVQAVLEQVHLQLRAAVASLTDNMIIQVSVCALFLNTQFKMRRS